MTTANPEPQPWEGHRPVAAYLRAGPYAMPARACEQCSRSQDRVVPYPCPVVSTVMPTDAELDDDLRALIGGT